MTNNTLWYSMYSMTLLNRLNLADEEYDPMGFKLQYKLLEEFNERAILDMQIALCHGCNKWENHRCLISVLPITSDRSQCTYFEERSKFDNEESTC